jgi:hypothetical protein
VWWGSWHGQALQSDSALVHILQGRKKPEARPRSQYVENTTIYGRRYLAVAIDEAHSFRNVNKLYSAVRGLREKTDMLVAMTATPVQTRPSVSALG